MPFYTYSIGYINFFVTASPTIPIPYLFFKHYLFYIIFWNKNLQALVQEVLLNIKI